MSFLAPMGAALGAGVGLSALGNLLGRPKTTGTEQAVLNADQGTINTQQANAANLIPQGNNLIGMGSQAFQPALNYYSSILSGNKGAIGSALAPEIGQINQGFNTAAQTSSVLTPRGGPRADILSQQPFARQGAISTLFQQARPAAAQALGGLGTATTGAGSNILGQATNALYGSTVAGNSILQQQESLRQQAIKQGQDIGSGLFGTFKTYGMPALAKQWPSIFGT